MKTVLKSMLTPILVLAILLMGSAAFATNLYLVQPAQGFGNGRRPHNYDLYRYAPDVYTYGVLSNAPFSTNLRTALPCSGFIQKEISRN